MTFYFCKMEIFVPESHVNAVVLALYKADAGHIGAYDHCLSMSKVTSTWRPLEGTHPYLGKEGETCQAEEIRIDVTVSIDNVETTIRAVRAVHPYEEPVINVLPLLATGL